MGNIKRFRPFVKFLIAIFFVLTAFIVFGIINIIIHREITFDEGFLDVFNLTVFAVLIILFFVVKKEIKLIKGIFQKYHSDKVIENIDITCLMRNKYKFINDAEIMATNHPEKNFALMHYDINKFTVINNSVGYKVGDQILQQIAQILQANSENEIIGKGEGDNFFVLKEYIDHEEIIDEVLLISSKIEDLDIWKKIKVNPAIKTGIVFLHKEDLDIRTAIDKAFIVKRTLKNIYKSEYVIYEDEIGIYEFEAKKIVDDMHEALENNEFKVYYQPKINLISGEITGAEALARWDHPELGLLSPERFIPIFEKNGFIIELDKYVLKEVCRNMRSWKESGYKVVPISVNVSRVHFLYSNFVSDYNEIKEKYKVDNSLIEIEITESVAFSNMNVEEVFAVMREFKNFGFEISIDDFGSGYSCLGLLKEMPIDTLKLDKMFLHNIEERNSQVIVSNIVNMAKNLNLSVVSEGVETDFQVEFLKGIGCDTAQGFAFARPQPVDKFVKLIQTCKNSKNSKVI